LNDPMIFVNQGGVPLHSSNAGLQFASARNNRAQFRGNQYGDRSGWHWCPAYRNDLAVRTDSRSRLHDQEYGWTR
jgi:hypothetical protein